MTKEIVALAGDGIGPEIMEACWSPRFWDGHESLDGVQ